MPMGEMIKPFLANPVTFLRNCLDRLVKNIQRMSRQFNPYPHFYINQSRQTRQSRQIIRQATTSSYTNAERPTKYKQDPDRLDSCDQGAQRSSRQRAQQGTSRATSRSPACPDRTTMQPAQLIPLSRQATKPSPPHAFRQDASLSTRTPATTTGSKAPINLYPQDIPAPANTKYVALLKKTNIIV